MPRNLEASPVNGRSDSVMTYDIVRTAQGWTVLRNSKAEVALDTKMAAFDSSVEAAMTDILSGYGVIIKVAGNADEETIPKG